MFDSLRLDERFLDRPGCGDELWLDSRSKAATWLAGRLGGAGDSFESALDFDFMDEDSDEPASH